MSKRVNREKAIRAQKAAAKLTRQQKLKSNDKWFEKKQKRREENVARTIETLGRAFLDTDYFLKKGSIGVVLIKGPDYKPGNVGQRSVCKHYGYEVTGLDHIEVRKTDYDKTVFDVSDPRFLENFRAYLGRGLLSDPKENESPRAARWTFY